MAVKLNQHDLEFILKQIKIAEAHASGIPLNEIRVDQNGVYGTEGMLAISQPHLPYGLRTVDGTYNNIIPGRELWGAADQTMPRMFDPNWRIENDGDTFDPDGPSQPGPALIDGNYNSGGETAGTGGSVADADPRIISNLISDQSPNNPAALIAALRYAGHEGDLTDEMAAITGPFALIYAAKVAQGRVDSWQKMADDLFAAATTVPPPANAGTLLGLRAGIIAPGGALVTAQAAATSAQAAANAYQAEFPDGDDADALPDVVVGAQNVLDRAAADLGVEFEVDGTSLKIPNVAPDEGLSAPFNGWMTFFGQFFDHGLDLISKGGDGTIYVPLQPDDPLYVPGGFTNFMVLTRATQVAGAGADGVLGTADDTQREAVNVTTPFVDQNQTYTSHPSHQVFLREYELDANGRPLATGKLLDGTNGGLPTWKDVKDNALASLGIELTDRDVFNIPLIRTDLYGQFIRDPVTGFAQVIIDIGVDGIPNTADDITMSGTPANPVKLNPSAGGTEPVRTSHSFLDDIAHNAVPVLDTQGILITDGTNVPGTDPAGNAVQFNPLTGRNTEYDNELLDKHFVTGDGRGNENIGLTAVHHVFHSEHNRQVEVNKLEILKSGNLAFVNEWLRTDIDQATLDGIRAGGVTIIEADTLHWDGERLFQTARFATEMQYQHLVFEEFGRKVQPMIDVFVFNTQTDIDPAIFAEFAHVVYRFGHSMLTEEIKRMFLDDSGNPVHYDSAGNAVAVTPAQLESWGQDVGLIQAFLNPVAFDLDGAITHDQAAGAIFRGMTLVRGNEIDEFVVDALRTNLLGLPLDLAAINIARGRDTGMPTLNQARTQLYEATNSTFVKPYQSWSDMAGNLKNPASIINFIAAYGLHASLLLLEDATLEQKRAAATLLVLGDGGVAGDVTINGVLYTDRLAFLNSTGAWTAANSGLNDIDLWIGGLAEKKMPFGGMLGSTFNAVFEAQMEMLQDLDRFYYLTRTQGLNLLNELENNAFSKMVAVNSDMVDAGDDGVKGTEDDIESPYRTGVDPFAKHDFVLNIDRDKQVEADPEHDDAALNAIGMTKVQRDNLLTAADETAQSNYIRFLGGEHVVIGGSEGNDTIISDFGDDAIWGGGGDDRIESGAGVDFVIGGAGNDIITDSGDTGDFIKGEDGDDIIANSNGLDVLMGGDGKDVFFVGVDATEVFAGEGDDFILGGADHDFLLGNEGSDWMEGGDGFDVLNGDNSELFFNSTIIGHDVMFAGENENDFDAESGDDIMVQGESVMRNEGMYGFDWAIHKGNRIAADSDMRIPIFTTIADDILRDRFDQTEALSGWIHNDVLRGDDRGSQEEIETELDMTNHELSWAGVDRIDGLEELLGDLLAPRPTTPGVDLEKAVAFKSGNVLIGGDGNDTFEGRGGDDFIHGDAWLNVRIRITGAGQANTAANEIATVDTLKHVFSAGELNTAGQPVPSAWAGKSLYTLMLERTIVPNQMHIVREILYDEDTSDNVDTAVFAGNRDWYEITEFEDGSVRVARREMEEVDPQIDEGVDTLVGIERIQFSDQTVVLQQSGNHEPVGRLTIEGLPAREGVQLKVSAANIYDANNPGVVGTGNVPHMTFRWQIERNDGTGDYINLPGAFGTTFVPGDEHTGLRIRVVGTYVDAGGVTETVMSLSTDVVIGTNDLPVGPLLISDMTPTEGQTLTMTVAFTDADGITDAFEEGLIAYQWQWANTANGPWIDVAGATGLNWTIPTTGTGTSDFGGRFIRAQVVYTDDLGNVHTVHSGVTGVVGESLSGSGSGNSLTGGVGDDTINGNDGNDVLNGAAGNDTLDGGDDNDTLNGGDGHDTLDGGDGNDTVNGGAGNDTITYIVGEGDDTIDGGADEDTLRVLGTSAANTVTVAFNGTAITNVDSAGDDADVANVEHVNMDLDAGTDTLVYNSAAAVDVDLLAGAASGFSYVRNIENVTGGSGADTIKGDNLTNVLSGGAGAASDTLRGGFGNDTLNGEGGNDFLYGEEGDDVLNGGTGNDRIDGGAGNDTASYAGSTVAVVVSLNQTATTIAAAAETNAGQDLFVSIENLIGSSQSDTLTGNGGANRIDGGAGADLMTGGAGDDTYVIDDVSGTAAQRDQVVEAIGGGNDTVEGGVSIDLTAVGLSGQDLENIVLTGTGNNSATGNGLANRITGNSGNNTLSGSGGDDTVVLGGTHEDNTFALSGANVTVARSGAGTDTLSSIENAEIGGVSYNIVAGTNSADASVNGGIEDDLVLGFDGNDTLSGNNGNDILKGGAGNDALNGGAGNDILDGGTSTGTSVTFQDNFNGAESYGDNNGTANFSSNWIEENDTGSNGGVGGGDIEIDNSVLRFDENITGGEAIYRNFNATGRTSVTIEFDFEDDNLGAGESILVQARNVINGEWETLIQGTSGGVLGSTTSNGDGTFTATLNANQIGANSGIRFLAQGDFDGGENFYIDNVEIVATTAGGDTMTGGDGDDTYFVDATSGLNVDQVVEGIGANAGNDTVVLTAAGNYSLAANVENLIVRGGGTRTLNGNAGDNQITGGTGNDTINGGGGTDTAIYAGSASAYNIGVNGAGNVTIAGTGIGTDTLIGVERIRFADQTFVVNSQTTAGDDDIAIVGNVGQIILGGAGNDTIVGSDGHDIIVGGAGDDTLFGSEVGTTGGDNATEGADDNDTFIWNATGNDGFGDGVDTINGGFEGAAGDLFVVNGNGSSETFGVYTYDEAVALLGYAGDDEVEIIVTRHTGNNDPTIIAELTDIEEIEFNVGGGTNSVQMFGDFSLTSLRPNTITVIGGAGDDTVDISSLLSAHRIVFKSGGGNDVVIGTLRPQDVVELEAGKTIADYTMTTNPDGSTTISTPTHSVRFFSDGLPTFGTPGHDDDDEDVIPPVVDEDEDDDDDDHVPGDDDEDDGDDDGDDDAPAVGGPILGTPQDDVLLGTSGGDLVFGFAGTDYIIANAGVDVIRAGAGDDFVDAGAGRDIIFADDGDDDVFGGDDDDLIYGEGGHDRLFGGNGNDLVDAGEGNDSVFGGAGNDLFVASLNDGNDTYYGGDISGDAGNDTLDMAFLNTDATVDLGTGVGGRGSAVSSQSGTDTLYGVENVTTGSGDDTITMSSAVNVVDGGAGEDIFVFGSAAAAHGDTIKGFEAGDKIDLSGIDANAGLAGNNTFTLETTTTAPGQIVVTHETREDGEYTVVSGNTAGDNAPEFRISIAGNHNLTGSDFSL